MAPILPSFAQCSSDELIAVVSRLASDERHAIATLVAALAEMDARKLHVREGCSSLFAYCTGRLRLSEPAACRRIEAARASRKYPVILERLAEGTLTLAAVGLLAKHLTPANHVEVLDAARHRSKQELEELAARLAPRADLPSTIRKLPTVSSWRSAAAEMDAGAIAPVSDRHARMAPTAATPLWAMTTRTSGAATPAPDRDSQGLAAQVPDEPSRAAQAMADAMKVPQDAFARPGSTEALQGQEAAETTSTVLPAVAHTPAARPAIVRPLAPGRYQVQVTVSAETHAKLLRARDLMRHSIPSGDAALIIDRALSVLLEHLEKSKFALVASPTEPPKRRRAPSGEPQTRGDERAVSNGSVSQPAASSPSAATRASPEPAPRTRHISAAVRREVWARSGGRCEFVSKRGHRCEARAFLEYHHERPFAVGGASDASNVRIFCMAHNQHGAETYFGSEYLLARRRGVDGRHGSETDLSVHMNVSARTPTASVLAPSPATVNSRRESGASGDGEQRWGEGSEGT